MYFIWGGKIFCKTVYFAEQNFVYNNTTAAALRPALHSPVHSSKLAQKIAGLQWASRENFNLISQIIDFIFFLLIFLVARIISKESPSNSGYQNMIMTVDCITKSGESNGYRRQL